MRFSIQQIRVNNTLMPGMQGYQLDRGLEVNSDGSDGTVYETAHHVLRTKPAAELSTFDLASIVSVFTGSSDLPMVELDGTNGIEMWGAKAKPKRAEYATSGHARRRALRGLLHLSALRWSPGQKAVAQVRGLFHSADGIAATITEDTTAPPAQPTPDLGYTLTAATVAGSAITALNSLEIAFDAKFEHEYSTGLPEPVEVLGAGVRGKLAVTARLDVGHLDLGSGTGTTSFVFTKYAQGGGLAANTVTVTLNSAWSTVEQENGQNGQPMGRALLIRTRHDGTNRPAAWSKTP